MKNKVNIDEIVFRCSQLGDLCGVKGLGATGEKRALYTYVEYKYGRVKEFTAKQTEKGSKVEPLSIAWLSDIDNLKYTKNEKRITDDYFTGECDIDDEEHDKIIDVKNSWDVFTFTDMLQSYKKDNEWQLRGYMSLYNRKRAELVYTLNDAPVEMVLDTLEREARYSIDGITPEWREVQIVKSMIFTNSTFEFFINNRQWGGDEYTDKLIASFIEIPREERIVRYQFEADQIKLKFMQDRVVDARNYLKKRYASKA